MSRPLRYLKPSITSEPLFNQWHAWSYLIPPHTAAMYVANQHLKVMQSFVTEPEVHVDALKDPAMTGGPYLNLPVHCAPDVARLIRTTRAEQAKLLELARAIGELEAILLEHGAGQSLEPVYQKIPAALRGRVELVYDELHHPSIRFIEELFYSGGLFSDSSQSILLFEQTQDERPFVFSTPRIDAGAGCILRVPFRSPTLDALFGAQTAPADVEELAVRLGVDPERMDIFGALFTQVGPPPNRPAYEGPGVRIRYFGHACVLVESAGLSLLTDPAVSRPYPSQHKRFTVEDLPPVIDYALLTHAHADHLMLETLLPLRARIRTLVVPKSSGGSRSDPSLKRMLRHIGFHRIAELDELETITLKQGSIQGLPFLGEHCDLNIRSKLAYAVELQGKRLLFAADSNAVDPSLYDLLGDHIKGLDALFIGMESEGAPMSWIYGPLLTKPLPRRIDQSRRVKGSNCDRALEIVKRLRPARVFVYAMGQEPWFGHVMGLRYTDSSPQMIEVKAFLKQCIEMGIDAQMPFCLYELTL